MYQKDKILVPLVLPNIVIFSRLAITTIQIQLKQKRSWFTRKTTTITLHGNKYAENIAHIDEWKQFHYFQTRRHVMQIQQQTSNVFSFLNNEFIHLIYIHMDIKEIDTVHLTIDDINIPLNITYDKDILFIWITLDFSTRYSCTTPLTTSTVLQQYTDIIESSDQQKIVLTVQTNNYTTNRSIEIISLHSRKIMCCSEIYGFQKA
jgi:hypothetical protein